MMFKESTKPGSSSSIATMPLNTTSFELLRNRSEDMNVCIVSQKGAVRPYYKLLKTKKPTVPLLDISFKNLPRMASSRVPKPLLQRKILRQ